MKTINLFNTKKYLFPILLALCCRLQPVMAMNETESFMESKIKAPRIALIESFKGEIETYRIMPFYFRFSYLGTIDLLLLGNISNLSNISNKHIVRQNNSELRRWIIDRCGEIPSKILDNMVCHQQLGKPILSLYALYLSGLLWVRPSRSDNLTRIAIFSFFLLSLVATYQFCIKNLLTVIYT